MLSGDAISWKAGKLRTVCQSTSEAEYTAANAAAKEAAWIRNFLIALGLECHLVLNIDNHAAVATAKSADFSAKMRHIRTAVYYLRHEVSAGTSLSSESRGRALVNMSATFPSPGVHSMKIFPHSTSCRR